MTKVAFNLDLERCVGCYACVVACMDQNFGVEEDRIPFRNVQVIEKKREDKVCIYYVSMACMHCEDAPCIIGCPTGAITKDAETNLTVVDQAKCIGCHSCVMACPFGAPRFDEDNRMIKCEGCAERIKNGLDPACVNVCPTRALRWGPIEEIRAQKQGKMLRKVLALLER